MPRNWHPGRKARQGAKSRCCGKAFLEFECKGNKGRCRCWDELHRWCAVVWCATTSRSAGLARYAQTPSSSGCTAVFFIAERYGPRKTGEISERLSHGGSPRPVVHCTGAHRSRRVPRFHHQPRELFDQLLPLLSSQFERGRRDFV